MAPNPHVSDARLAKALAHPTRVRILDVMGDRTMSPSDLAEALDMSLSLVSYHVHQLVRHRVLKKAGTKRRGTTTEHFYRARTPTVVTDAAWGRMPDVARDAVLLSTIGDLGERLAASTAAGAFDREHAQLRRVSLVLDDKAYERAARKVAKLVEELEALSEATAARSGDGSDTLAATAVVMLFEDAPGRDQPGAGGRQ